MIPNFKSIHNQFKYNGNHYTRDGLKEVAYSFIKEGEVYEKEIGIFLLNWLDENEEITVKTSGSTGKPKFIALHKQAMVQSALATGDYFKLKPGDSALLCLSATFIAGKMMLVRAIILGLQLDAVSPNSNPLEFASKTYNFVAMVPMQLRNSLKKLSLIKTLIVGGAEVQQDLIDAIKNCKTSIYATYGMTETITHIAVKKLNCTTSNSIDKSHFKTLANISISQDQRGCLVINAPYLSNDTIITNDVVIMHSKNSFELLGRIDNVINSGGIKIHPEQIEKKLSTFIKTSFFITSRKNEVLGEEIILVIEGEKHALPTLIFKGLSRYETPKETLFIKTFARTPSGKINRLKTLASTK